MKIKVKLSKIDKEIIRDIIELWTTTSVLESGKEIWNSNGKRTKRSIKYDLTSEIKKLNVDEIVNDILSVLFERLHEEK